MPDTENPRSHIQPVPLPIPSQIPHLRSSNQKESCDWENYERRRHQMSKCGYRSVIYKPYQPVGEVFLDDRKLILSALGQEQTKQNNQAYLGEKPYPLGRHIHIWLIQGSNPTPPGSYRVACFLYMSSLVLFMLPPLPGCRLVLSSYVILSTCHVEVSAFHWWLCFFYLVSIISKEKLTLC